MLDLDKEYTFTLDEPGVKHDYIFTSKPIAAFQLANNYEANLLLDGKLILCPLGNTYEQNNKFTLEYIGVELKNLKYKHKGDPAFKNVQKRYYDFRGSYIDVPEECEDMEVTA